MQFNDTSNLSGLVQEYESMIQIGSTNVSGNTTNLKDFTRRANKWLDIVVTWILQSQDEWDFDDSNHTDLPILTTNLTASTQNYTLPLDILKIKRVELTYDGTNWFKAKPLDISQINTATDSTTVSGLFTKSDPYYDVQYGSLYLYPIPDASVTAGLKVWISRENHAFTSSDTTAEPGFDSNFHYVIALGSAYDWLNDKKDFNTASLRKQELLEAEQKIKRYYSDKQQDRKYNLSSSVNKVSFK